MSSGRLDVWYCVLSHTTETDTYSSTVASRHHPISIISSSTLLVSKCGGAIGIQYPIVIQCYPININ